MSTFLNNRYKILQTLGEGGFGKTFLAEDTHLPSKRRCVVKQLKANFNSSEIQQIIQDRFEREAVILEKLGKHNEIPSLYAYFLEANEFYLVQELIEGESLRAKLKSKKFNERQVTELLIYLLPIIGYVHSHNIIHRDIKPDNIMQRDGDDKPVLIDFGAVKEVVNLQVDSQGIPTSTIVIGSPGFMPSEQAEGRPTYSSDLYSLGMTAINLLTGKHPFEMLDKATGEIKWRIYATDISPEFAEIIDKSIEPSLGNRFSAVGEMLDALDSADANQAPTNFGWDLRYPVAWQMLNEFRAKADAIPKQQNNETLNFSGYTWRIKSSNGKVGPGPNYFSNSSDNVWLDESGQLHLRVTHRNGIWHCAEVVCDTSFGYGRYIFSVASRVDILDPNVVLGLFTYDGNAPENNHREIDIEFARWGNRKSKNAQFEVQPSNKPGNGKQFDIELNGDWTTHIIDWIPRRIRFQSIHGHYQVPPEGHLIESWRYSGGDIPQAGNENAIMNLWLHKGYEPENLNEAEVVIKSFEFIPA